MQAKKVCCTLSQEIRYLQTDRPLLYRRYIHRLAMEVYSIKYRRL